MRVKNEIIKDFIEVAVTSVSCIALLAVSTGVACLGYPLTGLVLVIGGYPLIHLAVRGDYSRT